MRAEKGRPLVGAGLNRCDSVFVEMAARMGYDLVWIEMEHMALNPQEAADVSRLAQALGLLSLVRLPDARRETVLKVAEGAPDIMLLPMANTPEILGELVQNALYPPIGQRGFFGGSRAIGYGMEPDIVVEQQRVNQELCLMGQIETTQALDNLPELCAVEGISGFLIGPGDLSASMGIPARFDDPGLLDAIESTIRTLRAAGKLAGIAGGISGLARWAEAGLDFVISITDFGCLRGGLRASLDQVHAVLGK
jgi:2-keto-3-deoxy-L-rhamnonate aldolase RhmA